MYKAVQRVREKKRGTETGEEEMPHLGFLLAEAVQRLQFGTPVNWAGKQPVLQRLHFWSSRRCCCYLMR